jgi:hypothetical protein
MASINSIFYIAITISIIKYNFVSSCCGIDYLYKYFSTKTDYDEVRGVNNEKDFKIEGVCRISTFKTKIYKFYFYYKDVLHFHFG